MFRLKKKQLSLIILIIGLLYTALQTYGIIQKPSYQDFAANASSKVKISNVNLQSVTIAKVVDGDTVELDSGEKLRYIGVDTPETKHPTKGVECFGKEASEHNKKLVEGKQVLIAKDVSETDRYGRLLRFVYLPNPEASDEALFVNQYLIEEGYAQSVTFPPDVKYSDFFKQVEAIAREQKKGLWGTCN